MAKSLNRNAWRKIGFAVFIPLGLIVATDSFLSDEPLRGAALLIQVVGAILALPFARLVRWPFSDAGRTCSGVVAVAVFMAGKFLEWHLRNGLTYAVAGTAILLVLGSVLWWTGRVLGTGSSTPA